MPESTSAAPATPAAETPQTAPQTAVTEQAAGTGTTPPPDVNMLEAFLPVILLWVVFYYFFISRPDRKRKKEHEDLLGGLKSGDRVVTAGGVHGSVARVADDTVTVKVDEKTGTCITFSRAAIVRVETKDGKDAKDQKNVK